MAAAEDNGKRIVWEERFYEQLVNGRIMPGGRIMYGAGRPKQQLAFSELDVRVVWGATMALNLSSQKVMEKVGNVPTTLTCAAKGRYSGTDLARSYADRLEVDTVIYDGRIWTEGVRSEQGWRDYDPPARSGDRAILEHRDHVHVDVLAD